MRPAAQPCRLPVAQNLDGAVSMTRPPKDRGTWGTSGDPQNSLSLRFVRAALRKATSILTTGESGQCLLLAEIVIGFLPLAVDPTPGSAARVARGRAADGERSGGIRRNLFGGSRRKIAKKI